MTWRDAVGLAATAVRRRFGRAVLTVLAVALAAALLTALLTIAGTARTRVLDQLAKGGPLAGIKVFAAEPDPRQLDSDNPRPGDPRDLNDDAVNRIRELPGVAKVLPVVTSRVGVIPPDDGPGSGRRRGRGFWFDTMVGVDLERFEDLPITVIEGRLPLATARSEVAVTQEYLERLDIEKAEAATVIGTEITVGAARVVPGGDRDGVRFQGQWTRKTIVGVVAQEAANGELLVPLHEAVAAREWTRRSTTTAGRFEIPTSDYSGLFVIARGLDRVSDVRNRITEVGYSTSAPENLIASVERYLKVVEIVLTAIGLIALVIAALGIANAMLAAIRERRREIGVLKAIGARDRDVLRVFLLEAAVLGFVGGVLGTTIGWLIARTVGSIVNGYLTAQGLQGVHLPLPVPLLIAAVIGSTLLALAAGALPARRAARLPAREAVGAL